MKDENQQSEHTNSWPVILPLGDKGMTVEFGFSISEEVNDKVHYFAFHLQNDPIVGMEELVPAYTSLTVFYNPTIVGFGELKIKLQERLSSLKVEKDTNDCEGRKRKVEFQRRLITIPVLYGDEVGVDLGVVAKYNHLSEEEVIRIHTTPCYRVYMMGFAPGFPYLGGMSKEIATPRRQNPRKKVAAGSVGIAGPQTGVYSIESPGGWQIIGKTPVPLFEYDLDHALSTYNSGDNLIFSKKVEDSPVLLRAGDMVTFKEIDIQGFYHIKTEVEAGTYESIIESWV